MSREQHVTVYFDDHSKGHVFYYRDPRSKTYKAVVSAEAYDTETACEDSAWFCLFATPIKSSVPHIAKLNIKIVSKLPRTILIKEFFELFLNLFNILFY